MCSWRTGKLISWKNELSNYEQKSVAVTFATQLEELDRQSHACSSLLKILSFFDPESIPLNMITDGAEFLKFPKCPLPSDGTAPLNLEPAIALMCSPVQFQQAIQQLHHLSLIGYNPITNALSTSTPVLHIHDLVQFMIQESVRRESTHHPWFNVAARLVCGAVGHVDDTSSPSCWVQCETLSPHIQSSTRWDDKHTIRNPELDEANLKISWYLCSCGRYREAERLALRALVNRKQLLGIEHQDTLKSACALAVMIRVQGRYTDAQKMYQWVLAGFEKLLGPDHPKTLNAVFNLATTCHFLGHYE